MKTTFLILASILCVAEASFRSIDAHGQSFEISEKHPGRDAALIVIAESADGSYSVTNAVYVAPGKALTHAHESRPGRVWVVSPFAGCSALNYDLSLVGTSSDARISKFLLNMAAVLKKYPAV